MCKFAVLRNITRTIDTSLCIRNYHTTDYSLGPPSGTKGPLHNSKSNLPSLFKKFNLDVNGLPLLTEKDCFRRIKFASQILQEIEKDPTFLKDAFFSDEGNFRLLKTKGQSGGKKKKKIYESHPLPQIVWCSMNTREIIGPYFFNSHVTDRSYLKMLRTYFLPQLISRGYNLKSTWFQQDGAPPHRSKLILSFLKETFDRRLVSYGCPIAWPPKSQDLTPLDYFLWDYLKNRLKNYPDMKTDVELREKLVHEIENIDPKLLEATIIEFPIRLEKCIEANGKRFEIN